MGRRTSNLGEDKTHTLAILPSTHVTLTRACQGKRVVRSSLLQKGQKSFLRVRDRIDCREKKAGGISDLENTWCFAMYGS